MTETQPLLKRCSGTRVLIVALLVVLATLFTLTATATPVASGGTPTALATGPTGDATASTTVQLRPTDATVSEGESTTLEIVVTDAENGVGAIEGSVSVADTSHAAITDFSFRGDPGVRNVSIADGGDAVSFSAALLDTAQSGEVVVGTVTVTGRQAGDTDLSLAVPALGDEAGEPYDVGATVDAGLTVEGTRDAVALEITPDTGTVAVGEEVTFTVTRTDSDARVQATVTVGGQRIDTGVDGRVTVTVTEDVVTDGETLTATASKASRSEETFVNDSVTVDVDAGDGGSDDADGDGDGTDDTETTAGTATVGFSTSTVSFEAGETRTVAVVVSNVDSAIGAAEFSVSLSGDDALRIVDAEPAGDPGVEEVTIGPDNRSVDARMALLQTTDQPPIRLLILTVESDRAASGTLSVSVDALGSESGSSYSVGATPDATVEVSDPGVSTTVPDESQGTDRSTTTGGTAENGTNTTAPSATRTGSSRTTGASSPGSSESVPGFTPVVALSTAAVCVLLLRRR